MAQQTKSLAVPSPISGRRATGGAALDRTALRATPGFWRRAWRRFRRNEVAMSALVVTAALALFVLAAPLVSRYVTGFGPNENHLVDRLLAPGEKDYILGTDGNGRDILTRLAYGGRVSLLIALLATGSILVIGGTVGSLAGFFGGWVDAVLMRLVDVLLSIPGLALLILISSLYKPGPVGLALVLASIGWAGVARIIRGEVLSLRQRDYVEAARVLGATNGRIIGRHIVPNVIPVVIVWASLAIPGLILSEAALSYLSLGVRVPTPSWGNMLQEATETYRQAATFAFLPGFMIYITVLCISLVGDGVRDALDPRLND